MAVVGSEEHLVVQHFLNTLEILAHRNPTSARKVKGGVASFRLHVHNVPVSNEMPLSRGQDFQSSHGGGQGSLTRGSVVVEVHQDAPRTCLQIISIDGFQEVVECLFSESFYRIAIIRCCENKVEVSVAKRLQKIDTDLCGM